MIMNKLLSLGLITLLPLALSGYLTHAFRSHTPAERLAGTLGAGVPALRKRLRYKGSRKAKSAARRISRARSVSEWLHRRGCRPNVWTREKIPSHNCELAYVTRTYLSGADLVILPSTENLTIDTPGSVCRFKARLLPGFFAGLLPGLFSGRYCSTEDSILELAAR